MGFFSSVTHAVASAATTVANATADAASAVATGAAEVADTVAEVAVAAAKNPVIEATPVGFGIALASGTVKAQITELIHDPWKAIARAPGKAVEAITTTVAVPAQAAGIVYSRVTGDQTGRNVSRTIAAVGESAETHPIESGMIIAGAVLTATGAGAPAGVGLIARGGTVIGLDTAARQAEADTAGRAAAGNLTAGGVVSKPAAPIETALYAMRARNPHDYWTAFAR